MTVLINQSNVCSDVDEFLLNEAFYVAYNCL